MHDIDSLLVTHALTGKLFRGAPHAVPNRSAETRESLHVIPISHAALERPRLPGCVTPSSCPCRSHRGACPAARAPQTLTSGRSTPALAAPGRTRAR
eukprot:5219294-Prymnesium_polylepis.2